MLLLRSGLCAAPYLADLGVAVVSHLPGVGANLQNHPVVYLGTHLPPAARQSPSLRPAFTTALRSSSGSEPELAGDLLMLVLNKSSWHGLGGAVAGLGACLMHPTSRGFVKLDPSDPSAPPDIRFRMLTEAADFDRLLTGFGTACDLMSDPEVRAFAMKCSPRATRESCDGSTGLASLTRPLATCFHGCSTGRPQSGGNCSGGGFPLATPPKRAWATQAGGPGLCARGASAPTTRSGRAAWDGPETLRR